MVETINGLSYGVTPLVGIRKKKKNGKSKTVGLGFLHKICIEPNLLIRSKSAIEKKVYLK